MAILIFALLIGVVDENSFYNRFRNIQELAALKSEIRYYRDRYESDKSKLEDITSDPKAVERVARERYYMKRANEDTYVFADTTSVLPNMAAQ